MTTVRVVTATIVARAAKVASAIVVRVRTVAPVKVASSAVRAKTALNFEQ